MVLLEQKIPADRVKKEIRERMRTRKMTYNRLAEMSGVSRKTLHNFFWTDRSTKLSNVERICAAVGLKLAFKQSGGQR